MPGLHGESDRRSQSLEALHRWLHQYRTSSSKPSEFNINSIGTKLIFRRLKKKAAEQGQGKRVRVPGLPEFPAEAGSEVSDAKSPRFEKVGGGE